MYRVIKRAVAAALCLVMCCGLVACGEDKKQAQAVVEQFVSSYRELDFDAMYNLTNDQMAYFESLYRPDVADNKRMFQALADNLEFEITRVEKKGDNINIYAHTRNIDAAALVKTTVGKYISTLQNTPNVTEEINTKAYSDALTEALTGEKSYIERDTVYNLTKSGDSYIIESNVGIYDDLCGGYLQYFFDTNYAGSVKQALGELAQETTTAKQ